MKLLKSGFFLLCSVLLSFTVTAQEDIGDVDLSFLSGQTKFNLAYRYDSMMVADQPEEDYKKAKMDKFNNDQEGKGDRWAEKWVNARTLAYEPSYEELLNKIIYKENNAIAAKNQKDAKYTILLRTVMTEPGFQAVVMKRNPFCKFEVSFIEIATGKVKAIAEFKAAGVLMGGSSFDFDATNSIKEAYAKAGKLVGKQLAKGLK